MGAVARIEDDQHVGTGKLPVEPHDPQWGAWEADGPLLVRFCTHPDCDLADYG
jgi:hypothetical protein